MSRRTPYLLQWAYGAVSIFFHLFYRKQPGLVVLTAFHGDGYRGNTRVLFESLLEHPTLKAVWLSRSPALVKRLSERFGKAVVCRTHSLAGLKMIARADVILLTHGTSDYPFIFLPRRALDHPDLPRPAHQARGVSSSGIRKPPRDSFIGLSFATVLNPSTYSCPALRLYRSFLPAGLILNPLNWPKPDSPAYDQLLGVGAAAITRSPADQRYSNPQGHSVRTNVPKARPHTMVSLSLIRTLMP